MPDQSLARRQLDGQARTFNGFDGSYLFCLDVSDLVAHVIRHIDSKFVLAQDFTWRGGCSPCFKPCMRKFLFEHLMCACVYS